MRPTNSEITTLHTAAHSNAGMLHGAHGSEKPVSSQQAAGLLPAKARTHSQFMAATKPLTGSLGLHDLKKHRALIAMELEVLAIKVDSYLWSTMKDHMKDRMTSDWMDALQDFHLAEVRAACDEALAQNLKLPGKKHKLPNEVQVKMLIEAARSRRGGILRKPEQIAERKVCSPEAANEIVSQAGFAGPGGNFTNPETEQRILDVLADVSRANGVNPDEVLGVHMAPEIRATRDETYMHCINAGISPDAIANVFGRPKSAVLSGAQQAEQSMMKESAE